MLSPLHTDTAAQQAVATEIGDIATAQKTTINAFLDEVQAMQAHLQGSTGAATQAKAMHLNDAGLALMNEFSNIAERVGVPPAATSTPMNPAPAVSAPAPARRSNRYRLPTHEHKVRNRK
ncbi:hypothetical protein [Mycobacterium kyorinense]|uniref:hypothetical protein n=1 Tax=Mycobacterium kyorinense TaxID=487514 RepID=UPI000B0CAAD1|nr:hypothetical protein [Mycobacterium kyorinense]